MSQLYPIPRGTRSVTLTASSGQTLFGPVGFLLYDPQDLTVIVTTAGEDVELAYPAGYTVTPVAPATTWPAFFRVQLAAAPAAGATVTIRGTRVASRSTDVTRAGVLQSQRMEAELDKITLTAQELRRDLSDALRPDINGLAVDLHGRRLSNVGAPTKAGDAATKGYVDEHDASEAAIRLTADNALGQRIDTESRRLDVETSLRAAADTAERYERIAADKALAGLIGAYGVISREVFDTTLAASLANISPDVSYVETRGYSDIGDGGRSLYKRAASEPTHAAKFQSLDGAWWELCEPVLWATLFGAMPGSAFAAQTTAAIQKCFDFLGTGGRGGRVLLPAGDFYVIDQLVQPATAYNYAVTLVGQGREATKIIAAAGFPSDKPVLTRAVSPATVVIGGGVNNLSIDANKLAAHAVYYPTGKGTSLRGCSFINATVCEGLFGHPTIPRFYEGDWFDSVFYSAGALDPDTRPNYNVWLKGYATDNELIRVTAANAKLANFKIDSGGNALIGCHPYGSPETQQAAYCIDASSGTRIIGCYPDGFSLAGIYIRGNSVASIGNQFYWPAGTVSPAHLVAANRSNIVIDGATYISRPTGAAKVAFEGGLPSDSRILEALVHSDGTRMFIGHSNSLSAAQNARLQIVGSDFQSSATSLLRYSNDVSGPFITLNKTRSTSLGTPSLVTAEDQMGSIDFAGDDGTTQRTAARIAAFVDGAPGAGDMPGRLAIYTAADGSTTLTERLTVMQNGEVRHRARAQVVITPDSHLRLRSYTVGSLPSASPEGQLIYVSNGASAKRLALSDGSVWRFPDGNVVS